METRTVRTVPAKVSPAQLKRQAVVYVRQSTLEQTQKHKESTRLQYALVDTARGWGWRSDQIEVIDQDLGRSGANTEGRPGFQHLLRLIGQQEVGLVLSRDVSRLARSCRDWYCLIELCSVFHTLIADADGLYDPSNYNDQLLLGLKGTMSQAELHWLRQRMLEGRQAKAARGELKFRLPTGFMWTDDQIVKDPDIQVQSTVELCFELLDRLGSAGAVLRWLVDHQVMLPVRRGQTVSWRKPYRGRLLQLYHNPLFAGAYVYGRLQTDPTKKKAGRPQTGKVRVDQDQWHALLKDHHPGYISWQRYQDNQKLLADNQNVAKGAPRPGRSLLAGLLLCGKCGWRMSLTQKEKKSWRYLCPHRLQTEGRGSCQSLQGQPVDEVVAELVIEALKPVAIELSLEVIQRCEAERMQLEKLWSQRLERARYKSRRAREQYDAVDPRNRLVAAELEKRWEEALESQKEVEKDYGQALEQVGQPLSEGQKAQIREVARELEVLWHAETTSIEQRQLIVRQMIEQVVVEVIDDTEIVELQIDWVGGHQTQLRFQRAVKSWENLSYFEQMTDLACQLYDQRKTYGQIADALNEEGWRMPRGLGPFDANATRNLLVHLEVQRHDGVDADTRDDVWDVASLAERLSVCRHTVYNWLREGKIQGVKVAGPASSQWQIHLTEDQLDALDKPGNEWCDELGPNQWEPAELAKKLDVTRGAVYNWIKRDQVNAFKVTVRGGDRWVIEADDDKLDQLRRQDRRRQL